MFTSLGADGQAPSNHLVASLIDMWLLVSTPLADVYVGPLGGSQGKPGART
jgi:hypothetical protein